MGRSRSGLPNAAPSSFPPPGSSSSCRMDSLSPPRQPVRGVTGASDFLTADETAVLLRTTRKAIYAMAERGSLPGIVRIGRRLLVRRDVLLESLSERRAASPGGSRR